MSGSGPLKGGVRDGGRRAPRSTEELASYGAPLEPRLDKTPRHDTLRSPPAKPLRPPPAQETAPAQETTDTKETAPAQETDDTPETTDAQETTDEQETALATRTGGLAHGTAVVRATLETLSDSPGCYRMLDARGEALYVGMARNLKRRVVAYTRPERQPHRIARMISLTRSMEIVETATQVEALLLESNLIKRLEPPFNVLLRDDKSFPYILLTRDHQFSRLMRIRGPHKTEGWYFGPFASVGSVRHSLRALEQAFLLRTCSDSVFSNRSRPCLLFHMQRCSAPCVGRISEADYTASAEEARRTLSGDDAEIRARLTAEMDAASASQDFERAARLRDRLRALARITTDQAINLDTTDDADLFALAQSGAHVCVQIFFFRGGRNYGNRAAFPRGTEGLSPARILSDCISLFYERAPPPPVVLASVMPEDSDLLAEALSVRAGRKVRLSVPQRGARATALSFGMRNAESALGRRLAGRGSEDLRQALGDLVGSERDLERIEVFDNSHLRGNFAYGGMIVAGVSGFRRRDYRRFRISRAPREDDTAMMREVLERRLAQLKDAPKSRPDLWILDGGAGQLGVAVAVLAAGGRDDIAVLAVAKGPRRDAGEERLFLPALSEPLALPKDSGLLHYIQRLRDEAHRYVIAAHRHGRGKASLRSRLDEIPGVGPKRRRALLHHFGDARAVASAAISDLTRVPGISDGLAQIIHDRLKD